MLLHNNYTRVNIICILSSTTHHTVSHPATLRPRQSWQHFPLFSRVSGVRCHPPAAPLAR